MHLGQEILQETGDNDPSTAPPEPVFKMKEVLEVPMPSAAATDVPPPPVVKQSFFESIPTWAKFGAAALGAYVLFFRKPSRRRRR